MDVKAGGEGFGAGAGEYNGGGGGGGGEMIEAGGEFLPHPTGFQRRRQADLGCGSCVLFFKSIHLLWAVDLDMGDEGQGIGEVEVLAYWGS